MINCKKNKFKRYIGWILSLCILFGCISLEGGSAKAIENNQCRKRIVAYFTEWSVYGGHNNYKISDVPWDKVTHINYAFATIKNNKIALFDKWAATEMNFGDGWDSPYNGNLGQIKKYKKQYPNVKVLISIGGWSQSAGFHNVAKTTENRKTFSDSVVEFIREWNLDGADIDWEYPAFKREGDTIDNPNDQGTPWADEEEKQTFTLLLKDLRKALDDAGKQDNKYYELTAAVGCGKDKIEKTEPEKYSQYLDFINIMTYDMNGAWENVTGHQSPLYKNPYDNHEELVKEYYNVNTAMKLFESYGIPKDKLIVGSPYYSRGWKGVKNDGPIKELPGLFATATGGAKGIWDGGRAAGCNPYHYIKGTLEKDLSFKKYRDPYSKVPYLYSESKGEMYTYEDEISLGEKVKYVKDNNYGGIIFWELAGDAPLKGSSLTDIIYKGFFGDGGIPSDDKLPKSPEVSLKSDDNYGNYDISIAIPTDSRGDKVKLYENNQVILEEDISKLPSKDIIKNFKEKKKGTYTYTAEIINKYGSSKGNSIMVEVLDPNSLKAPIISVDKEINTGDYKISVEVLEGNKGSILKLYENEVEILSENIDGISNKVLTKEFQGKKLGEYIYKSEIVGKDSKIESNILKVIVKEKDSSAKENPGKPVLSHDNWGNTNGNYTITMNMWWGVNGDKIRLYENGVLISEANLVSNTPQAQTYNFKINERKNGKYIYYVELINEVGITRSDDLVVSVTESHK
ncbi:chitinase [Clostridium tetanomorphum]|uniref:chitinase n=1 Tax=Clostridium tetanomorphum TaxID=1553 RepID=A0A923J1M1_CLOTT|nr:glycosyl hydrolase family 18 protein [Clostridium tetanomorphum]KAJ49257.1 chitinase [Clostridium tetanomorphum DSM 665]KAJ51017.1 chitinase [Clostridium tetanomorphum DSM 665]MBC2399327.1 glycosyl hydrolase family 18 [Clostridium tetanomorphum]MBP1865883.1 chitinase [Clostridium tetanomorphum]NRS85332.1 chitinase [Clostridium tetanomorphum]